MTITQTITAFGYTPPDPTSQDQDTFDTNATAMAAALPTGQSQLNTMATQMNTLAASMNAVAAGTAVSIPYTFDTTTTDADPGNGKLRLDNATQNLSATIRADLQGSDGADYTSFLDIFDGSSSTIKGFLMLRKAGDSTHFILFSVSARAAPSGYRNISVAVVASSSASPFANNDALLLEFTRNGDKGDTGATGATGASGGLVLLTVATPSGVATVDFTSSIDSTYEEYELHLQNVVPATNSVGLILRTSANAGGAWDASAGNYDWTVGSTVNGSGTASTIVASSSSDTSIRMSQSGNDVVNTASSGGVSGVIRIFDPAGTASDKQIRASLISVLGTGPAAVDVAGRRLATAAINGLRLLFSSGNIASGKVKLYGVKKV